MHVLKSWVGVEGNNLILFLLRFLLELCMVRILIDTSTGLEVRKRKSGARSRASSVGTVQFWPLPQQVSSQSVSICIWSLGVISGIIFTLWLLLW